MAAISEQLLFFLQTQANPIPKTFVYNAQIAVLDNAPFRTRAGPALPFVRTGVFDEMRTVPDHPAGIKLVIENRANRARRPTGELFAGARPRSRYLFGLSVVAIALRDIPSADISKMRRTSSASRSSITRRAPP